MGDLTENFDLKEYYVSKEMDEYVANLYKNKHIEQVTTLYLHAKLIMQPVRTFIGARVIITSGYRDWYMNKTLASTKKSLHVLGIAADFKVEDRTKLKAIFGFIKNHLSDVFGELILYEDERENPLFIHVSLPVSYIKQFTARVRIKDNGEYERITKELTGA